MLEPFGWVSPSGLCPSLILPCRLNLTGLYVCFTGLVWLRLLCCVCVCLGVGVIPGSVFPAQVPSNFLL